MFRSKALIPLVILTILIGLGGGAYILSQEEEDDNSEDKVVLFMSYIPSVQFAPIYVAAERGYFAEEGITIEFENSFNEADGIDRLAVNNLQFGIISGEQVIIARQAEKPLVYVMVWYHRFPVGIVFPVDSDIKTPTDLVGKNVGYPGPYGASYMGLRAFLEAANLQEDQLDLEAISFNAPELMCQNEVDAAVVYIANEPLTIANDCYAVDTFEISDYADLVANGLVTNEQTIRDNPELVRGMVRAIQRGIIDTIADPDAAFEISLKYVPDLAPEQYDTQRQVLLNSIELWRSDQLGFTSPESWETTQEILLESGLLRERLADLNAAYTNEFLPEAPPSE